MESTEKNIAQRFLRATALEQSMDPPAAAGLEEPLAAKPAAAGATVIPLPEPGLLPDVNVNFLELVELRSSIRQYSQEELSLEDLSYLLWCTQGVKMVLPNGDSRRNVPSAGGRHAFETYLYIQRVEGLAPGLYRFLAFDHALVLEAGKEEIEEAFLASFKAENMVKNSAVAFVWATIPGRMYRRFGNRAYRYLFLDAGHVCENLYLAGQTIHVGICAIGAFYDDKLNRVLGLDGEEEFAIYGATAGKM